MSTEPNKPVEADAALTLEKQKIWISNVSALDNMTPEQITLIKRTVAKDATEDELKLFAAVCARTKLDPFVKQIHFVKRWDAAAGAMVGAFQVGIDGFRVIAERAGKYAGKVSEQWCGPDGAWVDLWTKKEPPFAARVTGLRRDWPQPVTFVARWSAYVQTKKDGDVTRMWTVRDAEQLAKCAEVGMLKIVAPNDLSGLELADEAAPEPVPDAPLKISEYKPKGEAEAVAKVAADSALGGGSHAEVVENGGGASEATASAPVVGATASAPTNPEPDYEHEAKQIMSEVTKARFDTKGGPARWERQRAELVTWATRSGYAPAVIDAKAVYGFAVAYKQFKAGEGVKDAAPVGTDPAPATEGVGGEGEAVPVGDAAKPESDSAGGPDGPPTINIPGFLDLCRRAEKSWAGQRTFAMEHGGAMWLVDSNTLHDLGSSDTIEISEENAALLIEAEKSINQAITLAAKFVKPKPRGPVTTGPSPL